MLENELTQEIAVDALRNFFREKPLVIFGTGISCAIDNRFGMAALTDVLVQNVGKVCSSKEQQDEWNAVELAIQSGKDLESSLDNVTDKELLKHIITITSCFVASVDHEYALKIANCEVAWPATKLLKKLVDSLPEGDRALNIITPNYDMLLEYACDCDDIPYTNGFTGGVERRLDWSCALRSLSRPEPVMVRGKLKIVYKA